MSRLIMDLLVASPLLFLAMLAATDPAGLVRCLRNAGRGVDRFAQHMQGRPWGLPAVEEPVSPRTLLGVRLFAVLLAAALTVCVAAR